MANIIKAYRQNMGATRFIGKKYGNSDRVNGMFGAKWGEWFENGWFSAIENLWNEKTFEETEAQIGLMRENEGKFEYWIGCFTPENSVVPEGYQYIDFPTGELGVCWVYGKEDEVFMNEGASAERLQNEGYKIANEWCFERYACPRFTTPDEHGKIILDVCFFIE
jgi:predicted transcriptional regulator YdeE